MITSIVSIIVFCSGCLCETAIYSLLNCIKSKQLADIIMHFLNYNCWQLSMCISDFEIVSTSCNWSYFGLLLPWRSGIQCCNLYIEGECCTISSYDNVRAICVHPCSDVGLNNSGIVFNQLWFVLHAVCYLLFYVKVCILDIWGKAHVSSSLSFLLLEYSIVVGFDKESNLWHISQ
jgi:hypothetical protein